MNPNYDNIVSLSSRKGISTTSRYKNLYNIVDDEGDTYIESYEDITIPISSNDTYHQVTLSEVNRLDIIAYNYYSNSTLYWIIALANGISDPFDVPVGVTLRIPDQSTLYSYKGVLA